MEVGSNRSPSGELLDAVALEPRDSSEWTSRTPSARCWSVPPRPSRAAARGCRAQAAARGPAGPCRRAWAATSLAQPACGSSRSPPGALREREVLVALARASRRLLGLVADGRLELGRCGLARPRSAPTLRTSSRRLDGLGTPRPGRRCASVGSLRLALRPRPRRHDLLLLGRRLAVAPFPPPPRRGGLLLGLRVHLPRRPCGRRPAAPRSWRGSRPRRRTRATRGPP